MQHVGTSCCRNIRRAPEAWACGNFFQSPLPIKPSPPSPSPIHSNLSNMQASRHQASRSRPPASEILILGDPIRRHRPAQCFTGWHRVAQGGNGRPTSWSQNLPNLWKTMEIYENACKCIWIHANLWESMNIGENLWKLWKSMNM
jgi:hypothetical protein